MVEMRRRKRKHKNDKIRT